MNLKNRQNANARTFHSVNRTKSKRIEKNGFKILYYDEINELSENVSDKMCFCWPRAHTFPGAPPHLNTVII